MSNKQKVTELIELLEQVDGIIRYDYNFVSGELNHVASFYKDVIQYSKHYLKDKYSIDKIRNDLDLCPKSYPHFTYHCNSQCETPEN